MKVRNRAIGSVCELVAHGAGKYITELAVESEDGSEIATYSTIEELLEYWETYKPTEPLIKDEKIRKAVRAWWETIPDAVTDKRVLYKNNHEFEVGIYTIYCGAIYSETLKKCRFYSIAELCGEEDAPRPLEPTFVDLDERIKEKEEE